MKKIIAVLLMSAMIFAAVACTGSGGNGDDTSPKSSGTFADTTSADSDAETTENRNIADNLPDDLDFDGATIVIHTRDDYNSVDEIFVEDTSNKVFAAIFDRNLSVEERLGVTIEVFKSAAWDSYYVVANEQLRSNISADDKAYQLVSGWSPCIPEIAQEGLFTNLNNVEYVDTSMPWWTQSLVEELNIDGKLHFVTGDISVFTMLGCMRVMVINSEVAKSNGVTGIYDAVNDGKWTLDYVSKLIKGVYKDDGDSVAGPEDQYGLLLGCSNDVDGFIASWKIRMTERDEDGIPYLKMPVERMSSMVEGLYNLMYDNEGTLVTSADAADVAFLMMQENRLLMAPFPVDTLRIALSDLKSDFMVVPYPKFDEAQDEYATRVQDALQIWGIPTDIVNSEDYGPMLDASAATLEALAAESFRSVTSVYFDEAIKGRYTRDENSKKMIDLIKKNVFLSFEMIYNNYIGNPCYVFRNMMGYKSKDFVSFWAAREEATADLFNTVIEFIVELEQ